MTVDLFSKTEPAWLSAPESEDGQDSIIQFSNVRLRRNIDGFHFPIKCGKSELYDSAALALGSLGKSSVWNKCDFRQIDSLDDLSRNLLIEMRIISTKFACGGPGRFLLRDSDGVTQCTINEEDHISISVTIPGLDVVGALETASRMESSIEIKTARDAVLGYLTSNPAFVGTGMSAAVMLHLPALDATGDSARFSDSMERDWKNIELRKFPPDDGDSLGSFYILSNRKTLGVSEGEIAAVVSDASRSLVSKELFARHRIKNMREGDINDRFWRTWGLLRHAKKLTYPEAMEALSFVKLGADIGVLPHIDNRDWRRILNGAQRNHMRMGSPVIIDESKEPFARAAMFRQFIESRSSSVR